MTDFCAFCKKELPEDIRQLRHRSQDDIRPLCCDRECEIQRRKRDGIYTAMSATGREKRGVAVHASNINHPRRRGGIKLNREGKIK